MGNETGKPATVPMRLAFKKYDKLAIIKNLKPSKYQRNKHPAEQILRLAKIMATHGVRHPIHISKRSGNICFGHGRLEAAKLNGWTKFPIVYQDFKSDDEEYICVQSDNAISEWSELDLSAINNDLAEFGPFDIELLGMKDFLIDPSEFKEPASKKDPNLKESQLNKCPNCGVLIESG
jgi:hypothetical protein